MSNYIEISNGSRIIINDEYQNLWLEQKITNIGYTADTGSTIHYHSDISISSDKIIMIHCTSPNYYFFCMRTPSYARLGVSLHNGASISSLNNYLTVYVFGNTTGGSGSSGVQVMNSSGNVIFDGSKSYLRVIGISDYSEGKTISYGNKIATTLPQGWYFSGIYMYCGMIYFPNEYSASMAKESYGRFPSDTGGDGHTGQQPILVANVDNI